MTHLTESHVVLIVRRVLGLNAEEREVLITSMNSHENRGESVFEAIQALGLVDGE